jgi:hypothetical protein
MTLLIHYDYVSWQRLFPGYGIDLTALRLPPGDDFGAGAESALKHLRLGRRPKPGRVAETLHELRDAVAAVADLQVCYAAVFFPNPKRTRDHLRLEFTVYDNREAGLNPAQTMRAEILDTARTDVVVEGPDQIELPCGPAVRALQITRAPRPEGVAEQIFPRLTICGSNPSGRTQFVIRSRATTGALADMLDEMVTAWARGLALPA